MITAIITGDDAFPTRASDDHYASTASDSSQDSYSERASDSSDFKSAKSASSSSMYRYARSASWASDDNIATTSCEVVVVRM